MAARLLPSATATRKQSLFENPVVLRDLRARMRGRRAYWHIAFYLFLLGTLAIAGYSSSMGDAGQGNQSDTVDIQGRLQGFYYFIFMSIAALVCLMAPAITAVAITSERQRLTLDLLVSTPMTAGKMLVGKLISSFAFLALLLALSLPASALCVIVGGATFADVLRIYAVLAVDGMVLAAVGLCFSCIARTNTAAIVSTYVVCTALLIATYSAGGIDLAGAAARGGPSSAIAALNPFFAVMQGSRDFTLGGTISPAAPGFPIPIWIGSVVFAVLVVRLLITIATYRLGSYGSGTASSLRRQILLLVLLVSYALCDSLFGHVVSVSGIRAEATGGFSTFSFFACAFFLPSLFTPALNIEDQPPGWTGKNAAEQVAESTGWYRLQSAFLPVQAAALPFFHLCLLTAAFGLIVAAFVDGHLRLVDQLFAPLCRTLFYLSGIGFLFWAVARRVAHWVDSLSSARALVLASYILIVWLPFSVAWLESIGQLDFSEWSTNPVLYSWVLYPVTQTGKDGFNASLLWTGIACYAAGILVFPFWKTLRTGHRTKSVDNANNGS